MFSSKLKLLQHMLINSTRKTLGGLFDASSAHSPQEERAGCSPVTPSNQAEAQHVRAPPFISMTKVYPCLPNHTELGPSSSSSWYQQGSHRWAVPLVKPRIASKKLHGVKLIPVGQYQYISNQVLHRKSQDMPLLGKWFSTILNY